jgi:tRNA uridine 5-carboxymethylaminomethyl modification enzyme
MLRPAYAVEYDYLPAHQCSRSLMTKKIAGLFFSGQINGTTGYEEAAAQVIIFLLFFLRTRETLSGVVLDYFIFLAHEKIFCGGFCLGGDRTLRLLAI